MAKLIHYDNRRVRQKDIDVPTTRTYVISALDSIEFTLYYYDDISKYDYLLYKDNEGVYHEYIVASVDHERTQDGVLTHVYAENSLVDLKSDYIDDKRLRKAPVHDAIATALAGTNWTPGIIEGSDLKNISFYHMSPFEAIVKILDVYKLEFKTRILVLPTSVTRYVDLVKRVGSYNGRRFEYKHDMHTIKRSVVLDEIVTALYVYGKGEELYDESGNPTGGYGRSVGISSVNGGKAYLENLSAVNAYGKQGPDGSLRHRFGLIKYEEETDPNVLLELGKAELELLSQPQITYDATVEDLKQYGYDFSAVSVGDDVVLKDDLIKIGIIGRVQSIKFVDHGETQITIGSFRDLYSKLAPLFNNNLEDSLTDIRSNLDQIYQSQSNRTYLKYLFDEMDGFFASTNSNINWSAEEGIVLTNHPDPKQATYATQLVAGGIRVANSKNPDGTWKWEIFLTNGMLGANTVGAYQIIAGSISSDHIESGSITTEKLAAGAITSDIITMLDGSNLEDALSEIQQRRIFRSLPNPPYDVDDQWLQAPLSVGDLESLGWTIGQVQAWGLNVQNLMGGASYVCINAKSTGDFVSSDWQLIATGDQAVNALDIKVSEFESIQTAQSLRLTETVDILTAEGARITSAEKYIGELTARDLQFESQISAVEGRVENNTTDISNLSAKQLTFDSTIGKHTKDISSLSARALTLEGKVGTNEGKIATLTSDALKIATKVGGQETEISNLSSRALTLENGLGTANSNISTLSAKQLSFESRVNTVENAQVTVFRDFPKPPYKANDIWLQPPLTISQLAAKNWTIANTTAMGMSVTDLCGGNSYVCRTARTTGNLVMSDWQLVSSDGKDAELIGREVTTYKSALDQQALTLNATVTKVDAQGNTLATAENRLTKIEAGMLYVAVKGSDGVLRDTTIRGDDIKTGRISSANGLSYWDLNAGYFSNVSGGREARIAGGEFRIYKGTEEKLFITNRYSARAEDVNISVGNMTRSLFISRSRADKEIDFDFVEFRGAEIDTKFHRPVRFAQAVYMETPHIELGNLIIVNVNGLPGFRARNSNVAFVTNRQGSLEQVNVTTGVVIRTIVPGVET